MTKGRQQGEDEQGDHRERDSTGRGYHRDMTGTVIVRGEDDTGIPWGHWGGDTTGTQGDHMERISYGEDIIGITQGYHMEMKPQRDRGERI